MHPEVREMIDGAPMRRELYQARKPEHERIQKEYEERNLNDGD